MRGRRPESRRRRPESRRHRPDSCRRRPNRTALDLLVLHALDHPRPCPPSPPRRQIELDPGPPRPRPPSPPRRQIEVDLDLIAAGRRISQLWHRVIEE